MNEKQALRMARIVLRDESYKPLLKLEKRQSDNPALICKAISAGLMREYTKLENRILFFEAAGRSMTFARALLDRIPHKINAFQHTQSEKDLNTLLALVDNVWKEIPHV